MYFFSSKPSIIDNHTAAAMDYTDSLPDECLALIFNFLTTSKDRKNSSLVSHRWLRIEAQTHTHLSLIAHSDLQPFIPSIFNRFNSLTQLFLHNNYSKSFDSINDNDMILITSMSPNLMRLRIVYCHRITDSGMAVFSKNCNKLKEFSCADCRFSDLGIFELLHNCTQLEVLDVWSLNNYPDVKAPPNFSAGAAAKSLKVIKLSFAHNERLFEPLIIASKNLTSLELGCCDGSWGRTLEMIPNDSCLVEVHLQDVNVTDVGLISVAKNCRALKKLGVGNFNGSVEIGDEGLIAVGKHSVNLQELILIGVNATCVSLEVIATNCRNLVRLELSRSETITDVEMMCIAEKCVALKTLYISTCPVSNKGIEAFALGCPNLEAIWDKSPLNEKSDVEDMSSGNLDFKETPKLLDEDSISKKLKNISDEPQENKRYDICCKSASKAVKLKPSLTVINREKRNNLIAQSKGKTLLC
ncbi:F-box domain, cyclin-like protein [Artemisia annua]|uniref:F-box domain, cyclin-like protein n=1 Tax=Artemisia annua TaxID=35608 RepID=A0A2U1NMG8_ARTAN|nr:F-box domain, cyclin-like protein [Artemisia annua]